MRHMTCAQYGERFRSDDLAAMALPGAIQDIIRNSLDAPYLDDYRTFIEFSHPVSLGSGPQAQSSIGFAQFESYIEAPSVGEVITLNGVTVRVKDVISDEQMATDRGTVAWHTVEIEEEK